MGQSNEPGPITWATDWDDPDDPAHIVTPTAGDQANGFDPLDTPPHSWVNWAWNRLSRWVNYLQTIITGASAAYVFSGCDVAEVPNATQVTVNTGTAVAGGTQVSVSPAETITLPNPAGTGTAMAPYYYVLYLDNTGTVQVLTTPGSSDTFDEFEFLTRAAFQADTDKAELAIVQDEGQATFDSSHIRDIRATKPIMNGVIESASIDAGNLRAGIGYPRFGTQTQTDPARRDIVFGFKNYDFPDFAGVGLPMSNFRPGTVKCTFKLVEVSTVDTAGPDGLSFMQASPWSRDPASGQLVGIALHDGTSLVTPGSWVGGLDGGMMYWEGEIDPVLSHTVQLHLKSGAAAREYVLHVETEHGVTNSVEVSMPAVP